MMSVPARLTGLVVVLGLAAGCGSHPAGSASAPKPSGATPAPSAAPVDNRAPQQIVIAGFPTETSPIYHYSIKSPGWAESGVIDAPDKIEEYTYALHFTNPTHTEVLTFLLTRSKSWLKVRYTRPVPGELPRKWLSLDPKKVTRDDGAPKAYSDQYAPRDAYVMFQMSDDISETSAQHYRGTTNLSESDLLSADRLKALRTKAYALPFTAVLDDQGRLTTVTMRIPAAGKFKADTYVIAYDQYGTVPVPKIPTAAEQTKAPDALYRRWN